MRYLIALIAAICVIACFSSTSAGPTTDSTAFQGSLTDASNNPVSDGTKDLILSIWTDSIGGTMLHSEVAVVTTSKGLFSTCLGCGSSTFPELFTGQTLFLQTQLAGQAPMVPRTRLRSVPYSMSAASVYSEATSGSVRSRGIITNKPVAANPKGQILLDQDVDGDGVADFSAETDVDNDSASFRLNGLPPGTPYIGNFAVTASGGGAHQELSARGAGANIGVVFNLATPDSAMSALEFDDNNDGHPNTTLKGIARGGNGTYAVSWDLQGDDDPESEISQTVTPTTAGVAIKHKGTGADKNRTISSTTYPDSAVQVISSDEDGDGNPEAAVRFQEYTPAGLVTGIVRQDMVVDPDDDGDADNSIEQIVTPTTSSVAIKSKGTGADKNRIISTTFPDSAVQTLSSDGNDGSSATHHITIDNAVKVAAESMDLDVNGDGTPDNSVESMITPTTSSLAIKTKGTGADANKVVIVGGHTDVAGATHFLQIDDDGDGTAEFKLNALVTKDYVDSRISVDPDDDGVADVSTETVVNADSATFRLNGLPPGIPVTSTIAMTSTPTGVHMEVGAATCDGTNWTNASDKNSKENFEQVNGAELLEKIGTLPITQWNYKQDDENVKHIGPTAQDFQAVFGLGRDDKHISTIDPAGVALAAIQALEKDKEMLSSKVEAIRIENTNLRSQLDDLKKAVNQLLAHSKLDVKVKSCQK